MSQWKITPTDPSNSILIDTRDTASPGFSGSTVEVKSGDKIFNLRKNELLDVYVCKKEGSNLEHNIHLLSSHLERSSDSPSGQAIVDFYNPKTSRRERCEVTFARSAPGMEQIEKKLAQQAKTVNSPITGKVLAVEASKGGRVAKKQTVVVIEAMKMENKIFSPLDGKLSDVFVGVGDSVTVGQKLFKVEA
jgi:biotin carboxyl carrier protein